MGGVKEGSVCLGRRKYACICEYQKDSGENSVQTYAKGTRQ
jgi:hypothetical protein